MVAEPIPGVDIVFIALASRGSGCRAAVKKGGTPP